MSSIGSNPFNPSNQYLQPQNSPALHQVGAGRKIHNKEKKPEAQSLTALMRLLQQNQNLLKEGKGTINEDEMKTKAVSAGQGNQLNFGRLSVSA